jgi:hypothetical protein
MSRTSIANGGGRAMNAAEEVRLDLDLPGLSRGVPIHVVATTVAGTRGALAAALTLASITDSRVYVIAHSGIPRDVSRVPATETSQAFANEIRRLPGASSPRVDVIAILGRQPTDLFPLLPPRALVFVGGNSGRWWPTAEQRTADAFTRLGCRVVFVHAERTSGRKLGASL